MMSRGLMSFFTASTSTRADSAAESAFSRSGVAMLRRAEQAHAERLERRGHRVRRVHAAARAGAGNAHCSMPSKSSAFILPARECADRLERADDRQVLALPAARLDRAAVDVDAGHVHPRDRHHAARHVLVAAADHQHAVHPLAVDRGLDAVGDHFARDQRILHAFGAHADAVGDRRHAEDLRHRARFAQRDMARVGERLEPGVARIHRRVAVRDADDRLVEVGLAKPSAQYIARLGERATPCVMGLERSL